MAAAEISTLHTPLAIEKNPPARGSLRAPRTGERPTHDTQGRSVCQSVWAHGYYVHECSQEDDHIGACRCGACGRFFDDLTCTPLHRSIVYGVQHTAHYLGGKRAIYKPPVSSMEVPPASLAAREPTPEPASTPRRARRPGPRADLRRGKRGPMSDTRRAALTLDEPWICACGFETTWRPGVGKHAAACELAATVPRPERAE